MLLRRLLRVMLLLAGLLIGLAIPWTIWLDIQVRGEFEGRLWDVPSRVYARALSLYTGKSISRENLLAELKEEAQLVEQELGEVNAAWEERAEYQ